ncbi:MAG: PilZ domain-containing protein [Gammaproteobacteria bacterium]|nr:PilZ domain-containing protein [Gammaproteobacteria bacterium]
MSSEHRQYPREHTALDTIYFTEDPAHNRIHFCGTVTDLGHGGIGMDVVAPHQLNDTVWLEGVSPSNEPTAAVVRWIEEYNDNFHVGLEFIPKRPNREPIDYT